MCPDVSEKRDFYQNICWAECSGTILSGYVRIITRGFKIKGWWRKGDIRTTKTRKFFECWVKTISDVPTGAQEALTETLMTPQYNVGKDAYTVDLESNENLYWLGTESGLLGAFGFDPRQQPQRLLPLCSMRVSYYAH